MPRPSRSGAPVPSPIVNGRAERRNLARREAIVRRIVAEFHDMPGLVLSLKQATRFLGVEEAACSRILTGLTQAGVLRRSSSEYYSRREPGN